MKILAVIPARGGSMGVKRKNVQMVCGKPLISYAIEATLKSSGIDHTIVSTDDPEIESIARAMGVDVPFRRPDEISGGSALLVNVIKHAYDFFVSKGIYFDGVLSIQPTAPLISPKIISSMIEKFKSGGESVATATEVGHGHPYICHTLKEDVATPFMTLPSGAKRYPRQSRPKVYYFNGAAFLRSRRLLEDLDPETNGLGEAPRVILMSPEESLNIDSHFDLEMIGYVLNQRKKIKAESSIEL